MDQKALVLARERANLARDALAAIAKADVGELRERWEAFLTHFQRSFSKLAAGSNGPSSAWWGKVRAEQQADPLLSYLHQARNADEHSSSVVVAAQQKFRQLADNEPRIDAWVKFKAEDGTESVFDSSNIQWVSEGPPFLKLQTVRNRGVDFDPPATHLGHDISDLPAPDVGRLALTYLLARIEEAEAFLEP